jgi:hypothetical protein
MVNIDKQVNSRQEDNVINMKGIRVITSMNSHKIKGLMGILRMRMIVVSVNRLIINYHIRTNTQVMLKQFIPINITTNQKINSNKNFRNKNNN